MKKICIVTDAWFPQVNGVVTTFKNLVDDLRKDGNTVVVIEPSIFPNFSFPFYKSIRLAYPKHLSLMIDEFKPDYIHVATEGPIGVAAKIYCIKNGIPHTSSFHTDFSFFLKKNYFIPRRITWAYLKTFHWFSESVLVPNSYTVKMLQQNGFENNIIEWTRGCNKDIFIYKEKKDVFLENVYICVSRVSKEKNLDEFGKLSKSVNGVFVLIGDGPYLNKMRKKYPDIIYCGSLSQEKIVEWFAKSDVFIFPSRFDTFGIVMLEALSCGVPVVSYNTGAASSIIVNGKNGYVVNSIEEMTKAAKMCLGLDREEVSKSVSSTKYSWQRATKIFLETIVLINGRK